MIISIEGCIASGKSTTARLVASRLSYLTLPERTDAHPLLAEFYAQPSETALETEFIFLALRYHQFKGLRRSEDLVTDFAFGKGLVFARLNLGGQDLKLFEAVYEQLATRIASTDLVLFLDLPIDILMRRIRERGRPYEQNISRSYLEQLRASYFANLKWLGKSVRSVQLAPADPPDAVAARVLQHIGPPAAKT